MRRAALFLAVLVAFVAAPGRAANPAWTKAFPPFRIAGNLYYVGSEELAAYLVVTPQGLILINSNLESSPALIRKSVEALGFRFSDIKILLISQGHFDHCAGSAEILRETHAKYHVMAPDVSVVESGGHTDFYSAADKSTWFPPAHVDHALHENETVSLGGTTLTARLTAGHNKGTTTWTLDEQEGGRTLHVVIIGGPYVLSGYKLIDNRAYPQIASDFAHGFDVLKRLPCDIFLGAHGSYFSLKEKHARWERGDHAAFVDPAGYKAYVADRERAYQAELARQMQTAVPAAHSQRKSRPGL